jgi:ribonuclease VapC
MGDCALDASAVLALLNQEPGADLVQEALPRAVISTVNLAEIVTQLTARGMSEAEIRDVLSLLGLEYVPFDEESAIQSGLLYTVTRAAGLSSGDRACLALARNLNAIAFTADRAWQSLDIGVQVRLIR